MAIAVNMSIKFDWEELRRLTPEQCEAIMVGVAKCISVNPDKHDVELEAVDTSSTEG